MLLFTLALALISGTAGLTLESHAAAEARILSTTGKVSLITGGKEKAAPAESKPVAGDSIVTGKDSAAVVQLPDGSKLKVNSNSRLLLKKLEIPIEVELKQGAVFIRVLKLAKPSETHRFLIRSRTAVMGVRGTEFFTGIAPSTTWMCVREGVVEVESGGAKVDVKAGEGIFVKDNSKPDQPKPYEWTRSLNWNMDPAEGDLVDKTVIKSTYSDPIKQNYD